MKKNKKMFIKTRDILEKVRKPVPKPSAIHRTKTAYNRRKSRILVKNILKGTKNEENST